MDPAACVTGAFRSWGRTGKSNDSLRPGWETITRSPLRSILILLCLFLFPSLSAAASFPAKRVLILYSFDSEEGLYTGFDHVLRSELRTHIPEHVEIYTEYLDLFRFPGPEHAKDLVKLLGIRFAGNPPDLVVPVSYPAVDFLLKDGKGLFPKTPIVTSISTRLMSDLKREIAETGVEQRITGVASTDEPARTLDLALRLQPDTRQIAVITGSSPGEKQWMEELKGYFAPYRDRVELQYFSGQPMSDLLRQLGELPPHSIVLTSVFFEDGSGQFFLPEEAEDLIAHASHVPVYGLYTTFIGHGVLGGHMSNPDKLGTLIGQMAIRVLQGEPAGNIPMVIDNSGRDMVDCRELRLWGISEKNVPAGTTELFREPSVWERYRYYIIGAAALVALETLLIIALVFAHAKRKRAERAVSKEKALLNGVIAAIPGLFFLRNETGKNILWNKNVEAFLRYPPGNASALENVSEGDRAVVSQAIRRVFMEGSANVEAEILTRERETVPYYFNGIRVVLEDKPYVAAVGVDISDRKQAEEAIRRSEAEMRSLIENAPYGIGRVSVKEDRFLSANPALVRMLGYGSEAEVLGLVLSRDLHLETEKGGFRAQLTRADFFRGIEFEWKRRDGKPIHVLASGRRIARSSAEGDILELMLEDVTAKRALEEQLLHTQKMEALGQLAGSVAHDFNNLLAVIMGYGELLAKSSASDATARTRIDTIRNAADRGASLTAQLLAFSRRQLMQPKVLDLNSIILESERMLQLLVGKNIERRLLLDPKLGRIKADPGQMIQVIMNLAVNARDAMPHGGTLTMQTSCTSFEHDAKIQAASLPAGRYVVLTVSDSGVGMDGDTLKRIFEPFFTTKPAGKGTGLGLATAYSIVKQSCGFIFAESKPGHGATFKIYLPRVEEAPETISTAPVVTKAHATETVLLVEDEPAFRELLRDSLETTGFKVLEAENGSEALRLAEQYGFPIHLLITDVIMPQMTGPALASCLMQARPEMLVLYVSGYTGDKLDGIAGPDQEMALLQKPFTMAEFIAKIQQVLQLDAVSVPPTA